MAVLRAKQRNRLDDSSFAYPEKRKLLINDEGHVRAAMGRFNSTDFEDDAAKRRARARILRAAKKFGIKVEDDAMKMSEPLLVAGPLEPLEFGEGQPLTVAHVGEWDFGDSSYGQFSLTPDDAERIVENFNAQVRRQDIPIINEEHIPAEYDAEGDPLMGPGAVGWLKELKLEDDKIIAVPDWNKAGERLAEEDRYRAVSPELHRDWVDPETGESHGMTLVGLALTNFPKMKGLAGQRLVASERATRENAAILAFAEEPSSGEGKNVPYAWPDEKRGPLNSKSGVKGAVARFMNTGKDKMVKDRDAAWSRIRKAASEHGLHVPKTWKEITASEASRMLLNMAADNADAPTDDDGDSLLPCVWQPPFAPMGKCPGYTSPGVDDEGDVDCCILAKFGCNGYLAVSESRASGATDSLPYYYSEEQGNMGDKEKEGKEKEGGANPGGAAPTPETQKPTQKPSAALLSKKFSEMTDEEMDQLSANMGENGNIVKVLMSEVREGRKEAKALQDRLDASERVNRLADVNARLEKLRDTGRITPAEFEKFTEGEQVAKFAESPFTLEIFEGREAGSAVPLGREVGKTGGTAASGADADKVLHSKAQELLKAAGDRGEKMTYRQAAIQASAELSGLGYKG